MVEARAFVNLEWEDEVGFDTNNKTLIRTHPTPNSFNRGLKFLADLYGLMKRYENGNRTNLII